MMIDLLVRHVSQMTVGIPMNGYGLESMSFQWSSNGI